MCEGSDGHRDPIGRRDFLVLTAAAVAAPALGRGTARRRTAQVEVAPGLAIAPRDAWGADLAAPAMPVEAAGDVRFLLVHHSASSNSYGEGDVVGTIRSFHALHTGAERGWPDVAYNFFVDRFGGVWEGRAGSIAGPVIGDATGGNQGYSQLACLIGDFRSEAPSDAALGALTRLLAWLASRYGIDPAPGAMTTFVSRGSNKHPEGALVETTTIAGHRDMSQTVCPGDAAYAIVRGDLPAWVSGVAAPAVTTTTSEPPTTTSTTTTTPSSTTSPVSTPTSAEAAAPPRTDDEDDDSLPPALVAAAAAGAAAVAGGAALAARRRRADGP